MTYRRTRSVQTRASGAGDPLADLRDVTLRCHSEPEAAAALRGPATGWPGGDRSPCTTWAAAPSTRRCSPARRGGFGLRGPPEGIEQLGGIDFDEAVLAYVMATLGVDAADLDPSDSAI